MTHHAAGGAESEPGVPAEQAAAVGGELCARGPQLGHAPRPRHGHARDLHQQPEPRGGGAARPRHPQLPDPAARTPGLQGNEQFGLS